MTTEANDTLEQRLIQEGVGKVNKEGVNPFGFRDPSGQYPKVEYENSSSLNFTARGMATSQLAYGGSVFGNNIPGISIDALGPLPSSYPNAKVTASESGHIIELNDTPGGERVLIMHNNGSGVEIRPDGTVVVSSTTNRVEICGGDNSVIVEGDANLTYKGNLTLNVTGDYNIDCLNHNVNVRGNKTETIAGNSKVNVSGNAADTVASNRSVTTVGTMTQTQLSDYHTVTKGRLGLTAEGNIDIFSGDTLTQTAGSEAITSSPNINIAATNLSIFGDGGTIGGENIIMYNYNMHTGKTVWSETMNTSVVYGDLDGNAKTATTAGTSLHQSYSDGTGAGYSPSVGSNPNYPVDATATDTTATALPTGALLTSYLTQSGKGVRDVNIDLGDYLKSAITKPALSETNARAALRDEANRSNSEFVTKQVGAGSISKSFSNIIPNKIGRSRSAVPQPQRGRTPIGNVTMTNASAPFIMPVFPTISIPEARYNVNDIQTITAATKLTSGISVSKFLVGKPLDPALRIEQLRQLARNYYLHAQFIKTVATKPGRDRKGQFEDLRLEIAEGYFRPTSDEVATPGGLLENRALGKTVVYRLVNLDGIIDLDATFELATMWKNSMSFDKLILDYDKYAVDEKLTGHIIVTIPDIPATYRASFERKVETLYNNKSQGVGLMEVLD